MRGAERLLLPRKVAGVEVASLPLTPVEAFVLSQLDGATEIAEVAIVTNLDEREARRVIQRLEELGAIETGVESQRNPGSGKAKALDPRRDEGGSSVVEEHFRPVAVMKPRAVVPAPPPPEALPPAPPAQEDIDLDEERRAQIDDLHARLDSLSHYQLLHIDPKAERKVIKEAYFRIIPVFHPDKYFGKKVGSYKKKLERVFERLTQAYEVLTRAQKRAEYDTYLVTRRATRAFDAVLSSIPPPPPSEKQRVAPVVTTVEPSERTTLPVRTPSSIDPDRRRRFADRILSSKPAAPEAPAQTLPPDHPLEGLRRLRAPRREAKAAQQVERFRIAGERAFEEGKWVSAVNALRIALSLVPEDDRLRQLLDDAENKAAAELAGSYQARATYEERNQNWEEAARSYQRVAAGRPKDHEPLEKAAQCLLRSSADPRQAVTLARQATQLAPKVASCRLTLARAFEAADLINSAMAELERARELSPKDPEITDWIARLKAAKR
jgi:curved DNA-binding protein CbpA